MKKLILIFFMAICSVTQAQDTYLCLPISATGYSFEKVTNSWDITSFKVGSQKYLLKNNLSTWRWYRFGEKESTSTCTAQINKINCRDVGDIVFDKNNLRYLRTYIAGYVDGVNNNNNTPLIEIGTCSPL